MMNVGGKEEMEDDWREGGRERGELDGGWM